MPEMWKMIYVLERPKCLKHKAVNNAIDVKKNNLIFVTAALAILAISGIIISL